MNRMKGLAAILGVAVLMVVVAACGSGESSTTRDTARPPLSSRTRVVIPSHHRPPMSLTLSQTWCVKRECCTGNRHSHSCERDRPSSGKC